MQKQLSTKVDRNAITSKVERVQFDACVNEIDRNIQNILQKIEGTVSIVSFFSFIDNFVIFVCHLFKPSV